MKKALKLFLAYFGWLIAGMIIGTFFYSLYLHSLRLVSGMSAPVFSRETLIVSFFIVAQTLPFITGFLMIAYRIRHPGNFLQLIAFILVQFISWCILFPVTNHFEGQYLDNHRTALIQNAGPLSEGYFRDVDGDVYYFLNKNNSSAVKIDTSEEGTTEVITDNWTAFGQLSAAALPYKDILIKDSFNAKSSAYSFLGTLLAVAKRDLMRGWTYWLGFLSLALVLTSIYALSGITAWRIANYSMCGILYGAVLFWNGFFWTPDMTYFRNLNFMHAGLFNYFKQWTSSPFMVFINLILTLILTTVGIVSVIIKKKRGR